MFWVTIPVKVATALTAQRPSQPHANGMTFRVPAHKRGTHVEVSPGYSAGTVSAAGWASVAAGCSAGISACGIVAGASASITRS